MQALLHYVAFARLHSRNESTCAVCHKDTVLIAHGGGGGGGGGGDGGVVVANDRALEARAPTVVGKLSPLLCNQFVNQVARDSTWQDKYPRRVEPAT